jgi:hypothetical protein
MAIGPGFYNQGDRELYAGGLQYLPQEQYRLGLGNNNQVNRLDFSNLSNSGIMSQAQVPYIYPPINQGGGDGRPPGPDDEDEDPYSDSPYDQYGNLKGMSPFSALKNTFAFMTNPLGYIGYKGYQNYKRAKQQKEFEKDLQNPDFKDMVTENRAGRTGGYQAGYDSGFMEGNPGAGRGNNPGDKGGSDTMGSSKDGGIIGYGGVSGTPRYQQFMYGGLAGLL